jgi:hypothetical protein
MNNEKGNPSLTDPDYLAYWEFEHANSNTEYEDSYEEWLERFMDGICSEKFSELHEKFKNRARWEFLPDELKEILDGPDIQYYMNF